MNLFEINFKNDNVSEMMKPVYIIMRLYEMHNYYMEEFEKNYDTVIINRKILDMIDTINFCYTKEGKNNKDFTEIKKVGYLLHLNINLDPNEKEDIITLTSKDNEDLKLKIIF